MTCDTKRAKCRPTFDQHPAEIRQTKVVIEYHEEYAAGDTGIPGYLLGDMKRNKYYAIISWEWVFLRHGHVGRATT